MTAAIVGRTGSGKERTCEHCGCAFLARRAGHTGQFCSNRCAGLAKRGPTPEARACPTCGVSFAPSAKRRSQVFCSRACTLAEHRTADHQSRASAAAAVVRAERYRGKGEVSPYVKLGCRHEHRVVAEEKIGRPLSPGEVVHHRDGDGKNNDPANLDVLASQAEHARLHFQGGKQSIEQVGKRVESRRRTIMARRGST